MPIDQIEKDKIISIKHPEIQAAVAKIVKGLPGDLIFIDKEHVYINESDLGCIKLVSDSGRCYSPIAEGCIPENSFFVSTPHFNSFDSRYAEFGLIKGEWIQGELCPIY